MLFSTTENTETTDALPFSVIPRWSEA